MKVLLDAHTLIWAVDDTKRLGSAALVALQDPASLLFLSAGTIWEISIKVSLGKLSLSQPFKDWMNRAITDLALAICPITVDYADRQANLPFHHRDPIDRLLIAQALAEAMPIVSADPQLDAYGITRVW